MISNIERQFLFLKEQEKSIKKELEDLREQLLSRDVAMEKLFVRRINKIDLKSYSDLKCFFDLYKMPTEDLFTVETKLKTDVLKQIIFRSGLKLENIPGLEIKEQISLCLRK